MIALIAAMEKELNQLIGHIQEVETVIIGGKRITKGNLRNHEVVCALSGIGKVNASMTTSLLCSHFPIDYVVNFGVAGGVHPSQVGDLIIAQEVGSFDIDLRGIDPTLPFGQMAGEPLTIQTDSHLNQIMAYACQTHQVAYRFGTVVSGDQFVYRLETLKEIQNVLPNIIACDMEAHAIAHVAFAFAKPFAMIRSISDVVGKTHQDQEYAKNVVFEANRTVEIVLSFLDEWSK